MDGASRSFTHAQPNSDLGLPEAPTIPIASVAGLSSAVFSSHVEVDGDKEKAATRVEDAPYDVQEGKAYGVYRHVLL